MKNIRKVLEVGGKTSAKSILRDAGYSETTSSKPAAVLATPSFLDMLHKAIPESEISGIHAQIMRSEHLRAITVPKKATRDEVKLMVEGSDEHPTGCRLLGFFAGGFFGQQVAFVAEPNDLSRKAGLDMYYKIAGKYAPVRIAGVDPLEGMSDEEIVQLLNDKERVLSRHEKYGSVRKKPKGKK